MTESKSTLAIKNLLVNREERESHFWSKVDKKAPEDCWNWTAYRNQCGYGVIGVGGKTTALAHRVAHAFHQNQISSNPADCVLHKCDNPACCNPNHLFVGTQRQNAFDRESKGRGNHNGPNRFWHKKHPEKVRRGENIGSAKLNNESVVKIRSMYSTGQWRQIDLAKLFGVNQTIISDVVIRRTWRHI